MISASGDVMPNFTPKFNLSELCNITVNRWLTLAVMWMRPTRVTEDLFPGCAIQTQFCVMITVVLPLLA